MQAWADKALWFGFYDLERIAFRIALGWGAGPWGFWRVEGFVMMIEGLLPYGAYKDSGLAWLGRVPAHWEMRRLRHAIRERLAYGANAAADFDNPNWPRYLRITDFRPDGSLRANTFRSLPPALAKDYLVQPGDLLLARSGATVGKAFLVQAIHGDACHAGYLIRVRPKPSLIQSPFLFAFTQSGAFARWKDETFITATIQNIGADKYSNLTVPLPPLEEQAAIVRFLDHANRRIDRYIRAKRKLIALLNEQKQAIIHRAVTRGLDPNVPMKDSGVAWLGEIPAHWTMTPNRALMRIRKELVGQQSGNFRLLSLTLRGIIPRNMDNPTGKFPAEFDSYQVVLPGDLIFCLFDMDETPRTVGLSLLHGMITGAYTVFRCREPEIATFLWQFYLAMDEGKRLKPLYSGLRKVIPKGTFLGIKTPVPPPDERRKIVAFIAERTDHLATSISQAERQIALMREYRTRLTADIVTGQLDVRNAVQNLPPDAQDSTPVPDDALDELHEDEGEIDEGEMAE